MAGDILLTPENLEEKAALLLKGKDALENLFGIKITNIISNLISHWHGEAQNAFENSFTQKRKIFDDFAKDLENFAIFMKTYATEMRERENEQKNLANKLGG